ncbi:hypothetical protein Dthio_PD2134 [Desulfonatronospira thiodismutans ASO3-1]|uniref:Uncharacterized protein n=1 Tax=Desulfonatronospira thiodismutans ASO3-1 TaxID=555779 RepID=D6SPT2_9BACT|nr:hypothetical protein [Desulfonatronospira thiodismutans]EFI34758.1 hypothetical protein Dthio_PD2134 [Desulfonatronospira thiodismutans ASO3-1]
MLIFAAQSMDHIVQRLSERGHGMQIRELSSYLAEINQYLPRDWRIKASKNSFFVRIQKDLPFNLVGKSYICSNSIDVIHFILTAFKIEFDDLKNIPKGVEIPSVCRPNLYYFQKPFPYSGHLSPLWARQAEKYAPEDIFEYHLVKPLTSKGVVPGISMWLQFHTLNGTITRVPEPPDYTHHKSYWMLLSESDLDLSQKKRLKRYKEELQKIEIDYTYQAPDKEGRLEYKYLTEEPFDSERLQDFDLYNYVGRNSLQIYDTYLDTKEYDLHSKNISIRLRQIKFKKKDYFFIDMKRGYIQKKKKYKRAKESWSISPVRAEKILESNSFSYPVSTVLSFLMEDHSKLKPIIKIYTDRNIFLLQNKRNMSRTEIRSDFVKAAANAEDSFDECLRELEIQGISDTSENTGTLARYLEDSLDLRPSEITKLDWALGLNQVRHSVQ